MHEQLTTRLTLHQSVMVVHPGIVVPHVSASNQAVVIVRDVGVSHKALDISQHLGYRQMNALIGRLQTLGTRRLQRTQINARGVGFQLVDTQLPLRMFAIGATSQRRVHHTVGRISGHGL